MYGSVYDEDTKKHPRLKPFESLQRSEQEKYIAPIRESLKAMVAWGWTLDQDKQRMSANKATTKRKPSKTSVSHLDLLINPNAAGN